MPETSEQRAEREIGNTEVSRTTAIASIAGFLLIIGGVPLFEASGFLEIGRLLRGVPSAIEIRHAEDKIEESSGLHKMLIPVVQRFLLGLGQGNERAIVGRDRWLFYKPDVRLVTGPPFLDPDRLKRRRREGTENEPLAPDPRPALLKLHEDLAARGIRLIVAPTPVKPMIYPEKLAEGNGWARPPRNASTLPLLQELRDKGLEVVDVTDALWRAKKTGKDPIFLATDTHWTPAGVEIAALAIANAIRPHLDRDTVDDDQSVARSYRETPATVTSHGDIARMLKIDEPENLYPKETVTTRRVRTADGQSWQAERASEVLLLGDSFSNIYSFAAMEWGEAAGLAERISYHVDRPIDCILQNDHGSFATRRELRRELTTGNDRLSGKRVVVYQFAARELFDGDWKMLPLDVQPESIDETPRDHESEAPFVLEGTIADVPRLPSPGSTPYKDLLMSILVDEITTPTSLDKEVVVMTWGMIDHKPAPASRYRVGQGIRLTVAPWASVSTKFSSYNRAELDDPRTLDLPLYWAGGPNLPTSTDVSVAEETDVDAQSQTPTPTPTPEPRPAAATYFEYVTQAASDLSSSGLRVHRGLEDWLFFGPELEHFSLGLEPFWGENAHAVGRADRPERRDPVPAILDLVRQLQTKGIDLMLVPVPPKIAIYPDRIGAALPEDYRNSTDARQAKIDELYEIFRNAGISVVDLWKEFRTSRDSGGIDLYCRHDTHWSPRACALTARRIAELLADLEWVATTQKTVFSKKKASVSIEGDLWKQLGPDKPKTERLEIEIVTRQDNPSAHPASVWRESPVLLIGDSHTLVFHLGGDLLASSAGLPDHLAFELGFGIDLVGVRGSGATAARLNLFRRRDQLAGKKILIWCFSERELSQSPDGWRKIPLVR